MSSDKQKSVEIEKDLSLKAYVYSFEEELMVYK